MNACATSRHIFPSTPGRAARADANEQRAVMARDSAGRRAERAARTGPRASTTQQRGHGETRDSSWPASWIRVDTRAGAAALAALLLASTAWLFAPALGFEFVRYDDPLYVAHQPHVLGGPTLDNLRWAFAARNPTGNWHPLTWISHQLDAVAWGSDPRGHHATSVLLHAINVALAFLALRRLTGAFWTSAACAALFGWHPLRVESVAWVSERKDVLCGFFFLLALWAWAARFVPRAADDDRAAVPGASSARRATLALVAFALGLMSKPMILTLPFVLLLLDVWPFRRLPLVAEHQTSRGTLRALLQLLREKAAFFALALAAAVTTYLMQTGAGADFLLAPTRVRAANGLVAIARYLGGFVWPSGLAAIYPYPAGWSWRAIAGALALFAMLTALAGWQLRSRPWLLVGWLWFIGTLLPVLGLVQVGLQSMADRFTYFPILGLQIALLWTLRDWARTPARRALATGVTATVLLLLAISTRAQLPLWHDTRSLFVHAAAVTEDNYRAHQFAADALLDEGRYADARAHYRRLLELRPSYLDPQLVADNVVTTHYNLGIVALALDDPDEAATHFAAVLAALPDDAQANTQYGAILTRQGRFVDARTHLETALAATPDDAAVHVALATLDRATSHVDDALTHDRRALALRTDDPVIACRLAASLAAYGSADEARAARDAALRIVGPAGCPPT
jgi:Flp pilus assembly protein TadD